MRPLLAVLALLVLPVATASSQTGSSQAARPSAESVRRLLDVMHTSQELDGVLSQMETNMRASMERMLSGQQLNAQQQKIREDLRAKMTTLLKQELSWPKLEPAMVEVYRNTFTAGEIDGMLKFYESPAGQAAATKLPQANRELLRLVQENARELAPRMVQLRKDAADEMRAAGDKSAEPGVSRPPPRASPTPVSPPAASPPPPSTPPPPH